MVRHRQHAQLARLDQRAGRGVRAQRPGHLAIGHGGIELRGVLERRVQHLRASGGLKLGGAQVAGAANRP